MTGPGRAFTRKAARVVREVLLLPFRLVWQIARGAGHVAKMCGGAIADVLEEIIDAIF